MMPGPGAFRHYWRTQPETGHMVGMVRKERLELSRVTPLEPKSSASTSSATLAINLPKLTATDRAAGPEGRGDEAKRRKSWWAV